MARADSNIYTLMSNGTGNGADVVVRGGIYDLTVEGSFAAQQVQLQLKSPNGTYLPVGAAVTANAVQTQIYIPAGTVRVTATATAVFAYLAGIG